MKEIKLSSGGRIGNKKLPYAVLKNASKKVMKRVLYHFNKDGWDLDYNFLITDVFYTAFNHHLEDYLLQELYKSKKKRNYDLVLKTSKKSLRLVVSKVKRKKKRSKK